MQARAQIAAQPSHLAGQTVGGEDELALSAAESIPQGDQLGLGALFALDELGIVDQQGVGVVEFLAEGGGLARPNRLDQARREGLGGQVDGVDVALEEGVRDGLEQMRLAVA